MIYARKTPLWRWIYGRQCAFWQDAYTNLEHESVEFRFGPLATSFLVAAKDNKHDGDSSLDSVAIGRGFCHAPRVSVSGFVARRAIRRCMAKGWGSCRILADLPWPMCHGQTP